MKFPFRRKHKPEAFTRERMERLLKDMPLPPPDRIVLHPPDMSFLTGGILNPIQFTPPLSMAELLQRPALDPFSDEPHQPEPQDCVQMAWEDREGTRNYVHNAYVSDMIGPCSSGVLTSVVAYPTAPKDKPINVAVLHNLTGACKATVTYLSIESAQQLVNQLSHAISVAETRT